MQVALTQSSDPEYQQASSIDSESKQICSRTVKPCLPLTFCFDLDSIAED